MEFESSKSEVWEIMRESVLEKKLKRCIETKLKGRCLKFVSPGEAGVPDRLLFLPEGKTLLVEVKRPGEKLRKLQVKQKQKFEKLGHEVFVLDSMDRLHELMQRLGEEV